MGGAASRTVLELTLEWGPGEAEDERMKIGAWVASKRKVFWTDLPLKGKIFHREAENRLFRRPREGKKLNFK
jgi:hypothetical protein